MCFSHEGTGLGKERVHVIWIRSHAILNAKTKSSLLDPVTLRSFNLFASLLHLHIHTIGDFMKNPGESIKYVWNQEAREDNIRFTGKIEMEFVYRGDNVLGVNE